MNAFAETSSMCHYCAEFISIYKYTPILTDLGKKSDIMVHYIYIYVFCVRENYRFEVWIFLPKKTSHHYYRKRNTFLSEFKLILTIYINIYCLAYVFQYIIRHVCSVFLTCIISITDILC